MTLALARAYGQVTETLPFWQPIVCFNETVEFLDLAREQDHWMPGVEALLLQLQNFLTCRAATSAAISFNFHEGSLKLTEFSLLS